MAAELNGSGAEAALKEAARILYDQNLSLLLQKARKNDCRSIWRVSMDDSGIIVQVERCNAIEKPKPHSFLFIIPGGYKEPVFGSFAGLDGYALAIADALKSDVRRLIQTNEIAYCITQVAPPKVLADGMDNLTRRFGELPQPKQKVLELVEYKVETEKRTREAEKEFVLNNLIPKDVFENFLMRERQKLEKRRKRKQRDLYPSDEKSALTCSNPMVQRSKYRYFSFHYKVKDKRYQFIQVYSYCTYNVIL